MLAIKLKRVGKKKQASFRIVIAEKRSKMGGRFIDDLGFFNPHTDKFEIDKEKTSYWLKVGAQPTDSVFNLLVKAEILKGPKRAVHKKKKTEEQQTKQEQPSEVAAA